MWKWTKSMTLDEKLWLTDTNKLETQALLGQKVTVVDQQEDWVKILVHEQPSPKNSEGYPGWIPKQQLRTNQQFADISNGPFALIIKPTTTIYVKTPNEIKSLEISYNTRLPLISENNQYYNILLPNGLKARLIKEDCKIYNSQDDIPNPTGDDLVNCAKMFLGLPYIWSGTSGFGFDCSGFTYTIYKSHGITISRDASPQSSEGIAVEIKSLQKGDLIFFAHNKGKGNIHHVGMYIGYDQMIHSPRAGKSVEIVMLNKFELIEELSGARRYLP